MFNIFKKKLRSLPAIRRKAIEYAMFYFRDLRPRHGLLLPNQHVTIGFMHIAIGPSRVRSNMPMSAELVLLTV